MSLAALLATALLASPADGPRDAALALLRGGPAPARALQGAADAPSLVVIASLALEEGRLDDADAAVKRLQRACQGCAEAKLLGALARERRASPKAGSFLPALRRLPTPPAAS
ncbi:MAG: hypothetical protein QM767_29445 [Anaeromyxobacter sp.]